MPLTRQIPTDQKLYDRIKEHVKARVDRFPSAYASGQIVQEYQAAMEKNNDFIYSLNLIKSKENKTISDLSIGDNVRIKISGIFTKGTEPRWSDEIYKVKKVQGTTITIDDDRKFKRTNLLKVAEVENNEKNNIIKTATRTHKITQQIKGMI